MKKIISFLVMITLSGCISLDPTIPIEERERQEQSKQPVTPAHENPSGQDASDGLNYYTIADLWQIRMRREMLYPFQVYLIKLENGRWFYLRRLNYDGDLRCGDKIAFSYYNAVPDEIASITNVKKSKGAVAKQNAMSPGIGTYLVASDPIEADVKNMFKLTMRYSVPFMAIETVLIETTDGNMIYVKATKLAETSSENLTIGDHFVYNVYTIYPNEVVAIKKL